MKGLSAVHLLSGGCRVCPQTKALKNSSLGKVKRPVGGLGPGK